MDFPEKTPFPKDPLFPNPTQSSAEPLRFCRTSLSQALCCVKPSTEPACRTPKVRVLGRRGEPRPAFKDRFFSFPKKNVRPPGFRMTALPSEMPSCQTSGRGGWGFISLFPGFGQWLLDVSVISLHSAVARISAHQLNCPRIDAFCASGTRTRYAFNNYYAFRPLWKFWRLPNHPSKRIVHQTVSIYLFFIQSIFCVYKVSVKCTL